MTRFKKYWKGLMVIEDNYNITDAVENYRSVISAAWPVISKIVSEDQLGPFKDDWLQANWEMIVECSIAPKLKVVLQFYGSGAECNKSGDRVWDPDAVTTHQVLCVPKDQNIETVDLFTNEPIPHEVPLILDYFVTSKYSGCFEEPPFDAVCIYNIYNDEEYVIPVQDIEFVLHKVS